MFDNVSQGLVGMGGIGYMIAVPVLDILAKLFMALSIYKLLRVRADRYKIIWISATFFSPIITRIVYEIYIRF
ncbi:MAG: hypothetical protein IJW21_06235, partial [Clostridia bacterium]|nr:hypothetical protein [Clostridia bacterium]